MDGRPLPSPAASCRGSHLPQPIPSYDDNDDDDDSELSSLRTTPSPPSSRAMSPVRPSVSPLTERGSPYPSPPCSQDSSRATPCPDRSLSGCTSAAEDSDARPVKRRRLSPRMPRDVRHLDLDELQYPDQQAELDRLIRAIKTKRKIVVVAGAGISVSAGIPDFRSSTGLFNSLKAQHNLKGSGKHLFDAAVYRDSNSTTSFHEMVRSLSTLTKSASPTRFHHLVARLAQEGRLLRLYSQNVDGIDTSLPPLATEVPLPCKGPWPKTVQLHGGLTHMVCQKCAKLYGLQPDLFDGPIPPECEECQQTDHARTTLAGKRSHGIGKLRPRMVLYNEHNPDDEAIGACAKADLRKRPDCIIVVGTSLKVPGVRRIVREMCSIVRDHRDGLSVWINNDPEPSSREFDNCWDMIVKGTSDDVAAHAALRQWDDVEIGDVKDCTEDEVARVEERGRPKVVVESPTKLRIGTSHESLPTPLNSPRFGVKSEDGTGQGGGTKKAVPNPASKGQPLKKVIKPQPSKLSGKRSTTKPGILGNRQSTSKAAPAKKPMTKKPSTKTSQSPRLHSGQLHFKTTKANVAAPPKPKSDEADVPKRPEPLATSPTRENMHAVSKQMPKWLCTNREAAPTKENA